MASEPNLSPSVASDAVSSNCGSVDVDILFIVASIVCGGSVFGPSSIVCGGSVFGPFN